MNVYGKQKNSSSNNLARYGGWLSVKRTSRTSRHDCSVSMCMCMHPQLCRMAEEIECMTTDNSVVVSSCLSGHLRSGLLVRRVLYHHRQKTKSKHVLETDDLEDVDSDYGSGSSPSRSELGLSSKALR